MSLAQGNNTPTWPRIEPGSPDPESDTLTTRPVRPLGLGFEETTFCNKFHKKKKLERYNIRIFTPSGIFCYVGQGYELGYKPITAEEIRCVFDDI